MYRRKSGLVMLDDMTSDKGHWNSIPSSVWDFSAREGYGRMNRKETDQFALMETPALDEFFVDFKQDYEPIEELDKGGLVLFKEIEDKVVALEKKDLSQGDHDIWRLWYKNNYWNVFSRQNGEWHYLDSIKDDGFHKFGLVLKGAPLPTLLGSTTSGGGPFTRNTHQLGEQGGEVVINYNMYGIPDGMNVYYDDELIASTDGLVIHSGSLSFMYNPNLAGPFEIVVEVFSDAPSTGWWYQVVYDTTGGAANNYQNFDIESVCICKAKDVTVGNTPSGYKVQLHDKDDNLIEHKVVPDGFSGVKIDLPALAFDGKIKILNKNDHEISTYAGYIYGGDVFFCGSNLQLRDAGEELDRFNPNNIGSMTAGFLVKKLELYNPTTSTVTDIQLRVKQYSNKFGWQWVELAIQEDGEYSDVLEIESLDGLDYIDFYIKLERVLENDYEGEGLEPLYFVVDISHA